MCREKRKHEKVGSGKCEVERGGNKNKKNVALRKEGRSC